MSSDAVAEDIIIDNSETVTTEEEKNDPLIEEEEEDNPVVNPKIGWMNLKFAKFKVVEEKIEKKDSIFETDLDVKITTTKLPEKFRKDTDSNISFDKELEPYQKYSYDYLVNGTFIKVEKPNNFKQIATPEKPKNTTPEDGLVNFRAFMQESRLPGTEDEKPEEKKQTQKTQETNQKQEVEFNFSLQTEKDIEEKRKYVFDELSKLPKSLLYNPFHVWNNVEVTKFERPVDSIPYFELKYEHLLLIISRDTKIRLTFNKFEVSVGNFEPLFCKLSLYDAKNETFLNGTHHFFLNATAEDVAFLPNFPKEFITDKKEMVILSLPEVHSNIFIVIFAERILQPNSQNDTYLKKKINVQTSKESVAESWEINPKLRQPLFWTFEPLFEVDQEKKKKGNDRNTNEKVFLKQGPRKISKLYQNIGEYKSRVKLYEVLLSNSNSAIKKAKLIPGFLGIVVEQISDDKINEGEKSLLKFHKDYDSLYNLHFQHFLILELTSANLSNVGGNNIVLRVSLREDDDLTKPPLKKIHTRFSAEERIEKDFSSITVHQKAPQFFDEIRIDLPFNLTKNHHLLFEFLDVDFDKQNKTELILKPIGYSIVRIITDNLLDGHLIENIYKDLPAKYLERLDSLEPIDKKKKSFKFSCHSYTTALPKCPVTFQFLRMCPFFFEKDQTEMSLELFDYISSFLLPNAITASKNMMKCNFENVYQNLPSILNISLYILANGKEGTPEQKEKDPKFSDKMKEVSKSAFDILLSLSSGVIKFFPSIGNRNSYLDSYLEYILNIPQISIVPLHHTITEHWLEKLNTIVNEDPKLLKNNEVSESFRKSSLTGEIPKKRRDRGVSLFGNTKDKKKIENVTNSTKEIKLVDSRECIHLSWFILELLSKILFLYSKSTIGGEKKKYTYEQFGKDDVFFDNLHFSGVLETLLKKTIEIGGEVAIKTNFAISLFLKDLLTISFQPNMIDSNFRTNTLNLLLEYLKHLEWRNTDLPMTMKLDFVELILDHENFIEMSWKLDQRTLSKCCIQVLCDAFINDQYRIRVINIMYQIFSKWDMTEKYQKIEQKNAISILLLPLLDFIVDDEEVIKGIEKTSSKDEKITKRFWPVFLQIFNNCETKKFEEWLNSKSVPSLERFILLIPKTIKGFKDIQDKSYIRTCKFVGLKLISTLSTSLENRIKVNGEYLILETIVKVIVNHLDKNSPNLDKLELEEDDVFFLTILNEIINKYTDVLCTQNQIMWKWIVGILLKPLDFPLSETKNHVLIHGLNILTKPYETEIKTNSKDSRLIIPEDSDDSIVFQDLNFIKAATLDKLIERMTYEKHPELKFKDIFLLTYRSFTTPFILLDKLIQRFRQAILVDPEGSDKITLRVLNSIKFWVDKYFYDFDNVLVTRLIKFLSDEVSLSPRLRIFCKTLKRSLAVKLITDDAITASDYNFKDLAEEPVYPKNFNRDDKNFPFVLLSWDSREIAKQMTILESILFKSIAPKECLSGAWAKPKTKHLHAPNIVALTDRWNRVTEYVSTTVMSEPDMKKRRRIIQKFIDIANELSNLNNYHGVTEIIAGLQTVAVHRLKKTWAGLPEQSMELFKSLSDLIDSMGAYKAMRDRLKQSTPPCIPPMAMYLKDLIFIEDGNPDEIKSQPNQVPLVNFFKRRTVAEVILKMREYQLSPYNFVQIPYLRDHLGSKLFEEGKLLNDEQMWSNSLKFEPREQK